MGYVLVRRLALALSALLAAAALGFGWLASRTPPDPATFGSDPEALFERHCGGCHDVPTLSATVGTAGDRTAKAAELVAFLAEHGGASPEANRLIVTLLLGPDATAPADRVRSP